MRTGTARMLAITLAATALLASGCAFITRTSLRTDGAEATGASFGTPAASSDGRYVAFYSTASNLVDGDTNGVADAFVRDVLTGTTERVSVGAGAAQANGASGGTTGEIDVSADGRYVAFESAASNLVTGDTNGDTDVFVRDRAANTTTRVSRPQAIIGTQGDDASYGPSISDDGSRIAFTTDATNMVLSDFNFSSDVFIATAAQGVVAAASLRGTNQPANDDSFEAAISGDGLKVAYASRATNLVQPDSNGQIDVFVRDTATSTTSLASVSSTGAQATGGGSRNPVLSADGRHVAFDSTAADLVAGDANGAADVFVRDRTTGTTTRVSRSTGGIAANGASTRPGISGDGRVVAFESAATNLVAGDTNGFADVFVHDRDSELTQRASSDLVFGAANAASSGATVSGDARYVAFVSSASNLELDRPDTNGVADVLVRASLSPEITTFAPASIARGQSNVEFTMTGRGFLPLARASGSTGITLTVTSVTPTSVSGTASAARNATLGTVDALVSNAGSGPGADKGSLGKCALCLTVTP